MKKTRVLMVLMMFCTLIAGVAKGEIVAYYAFEDNLDSSINTDVGSVGAGSVSYVSSTTGFGQAAYLNGSSYLNLPDVNLTGSQMTVASWIKDDVAATTNNFSGIITHDGFESDWSFRRYSLNGVPGFEHFSGRMSFVAGDDTANALPSTGEVIDADSWYHLAVTFDSGAVTYYVNGVASGSYTSVTTSITDTEAVELLVGYDASKVAYFQGAIDEVRIYDNTLTGTEVAALMTVPEPATMTLLVVGGIGFLARRKK